MRLILSHEFTYFSVFLIGLSHKISNHLILDVVIQVSQNLQSAKKLILAQECFLVKNLQNKACHSAILTDF